MPVDFTTSTAKASVNFGDGGAHDPQIKFQADDESCVWNGFHVAIIMCPFEDIVLVDPDPTSQLQVFTTAPGAGGTVPAESDWPYMRVYGAQKAAIMGYDLACRMRFNASGSTSVGSVGVTRIGSTACADIHPGPIAGDYVESVFSPCGTCVDCLLTDEPVLYGINFTNFSPITGGVTIGANGLWGRLECQWCASGVTPTAVYEPFQVARYEYVPPCPPLEDGHLYIYPTIDSCGLGTMTYTNLATAINALNIPITATVLGGHGSDLVAPDPAATLDTFCCLGCFYGKAMAGAECGGAVDWPFTG